MRARSTMTTLGAACLAVTLLFGSATAAPVPASFGRAIAAVLGRTGKVAANAYLVPIPRSDLHESIDGFPLPTAFGFGGWVAFIPHGDHAVLMGDLPLKPTEIDAVIRALQAHGIAVSGIHNHFLGESEPLMFVHVMGMGSARDLAAGVRAALAATAAPIPHPPAAPPVSGLNDAEIARIVGHPGVVPGPSVFKITLGRPRLRIRAMGVAMTTPLVNTWAAFTGTDSDAAVAGDIAMTAGEVDPVLRALEGHGLKVLALHNHMTAETPRIFFVHYYGRGPVAALARGFRAALQALHAGRREWPAAAEPTSPGSYRPLRGSVLRLDAGLATGERASNG